MAVTIESNRDDAKAMTDALKVFGMTPREEPAPTEQPKEEVAPATDAEKPPSEVAGAEGGEKPPADPGTKTAAEPDPVDKSQEASPQPHETDRERKSRESRGGLKAKLDRLTAEKAELKEELAAKTGNEYRLRERLEELEAEMATLKAPKEPEKQPELVRPKRPTKKEFDYDEDKYEAALAQYDEDLATYYDKVADQKANDAVAAAQKTREEADRQAALERQSREFTERRSQDAKFYEDFEDMTAAVPKDASTLVDQRPVAADYIANKSKHPAHLIYYLSQDVVENGSAENQRLAALDDYDLHIALREIEEQMHKTATGKAMPEKEKTPPAEPPAATTEKPPATEVIPIRPKTPDEPINPVGLRGTVAKRDELAEAAKRGDQRTVNRLVLQGLERKAGRV